MNKKKLHIQKMIAISNGMQRYIRKGECLQCGACCLHENCDNFIFLKNDNAFCNIHIDKDRPEKCKIYPANPPLNFKSCGYYFIDKTDNRTIRYGDKL